MEIRFFSILLALLVGCGGTGEAVGPGGAGASGGTGGVAGPGGSGGHVGPGGTGGAPPDGSFVIKWGPTEVPPARETTQCVVKRLGNDAPVFINQIHNVLGATSHHFIVYQVDDEAERLEPYDCSPFEGSGSQSKLLMITQKSDDLLRFPEGVAYELEPGQMIRLELHYINVTSAPQMAEATSTFGAVNEDRVQFRAGIEFLGPLGFPTIPGGETATYESLVSVGSGFESANFFAITGHQHKLGTNVLVELLDEDRAVVERVYDVENFIWDEPETVRHDPPFQIPSGGALNVTCDWNNTTEEPVGFGLSVDDEMCFFWAYYYQ